LEKNISILAKATQVSDVAHGPLVQDVMTLGLGEKIKNYQFSELFLSMCLQIFI
jgi:hypothetical protein